MTDDDNDGFLGQFKKCVICGTQVLCMFGSDTTPKCNTHPEDKK